MSFLTSHDTLLDIRILRATATRPLQFPYHFISAAASVSSSSATVILLFGVLGEACMHISGCLDATQGESRQACISRVRGRERKEVPELPHGTESERAMRSGDERQIVCATCS